MHGAALAGLIDQDITARVRSAWKLEQQKDSTQGRTSRDKGQKLERSGSSGTRRALKKKVTKPRTHAKRVTGWNLYVKHNHNRVKARLEQTHGEGVLENTETLKAIRAEYDAASDKEKARYDREAEIRNREARRLFNMPAAKKARRKQLLLWRKQEKEKRVWKAHAKKTQAKKARKLEQKREKKREEKKTLDGREWVTCFQSGKRRRAVNKGVEWMVRLARPHETFATYGPDFIQFFTELASVTGDPVRRFVLIHLNTLAQRWRKEMLTGGWKEEDEPVSPYDVIEFITGTYALQRAGIPSPMKDKVCRYVNTKTCRPPTSPHQNGSSNKDEMPEEEEEEEEEEISGKGASASSAPSMRGHCTFDSMDLIGWDPRREPPPEGMTEMCSYCGWTSPRGRKMCSNRSCGRKLTVITRARAFNNALTNTFYAEATGLSLGYHDYESVLRYLPTFRPYGTLSEMSFMDFNDLCYLVTHVIFTLSNWGELCLDPELFAHERSFIRCNLDWAIRRCDPHLVGEFVQCLRILGDTDDDPLLQAGFESLLGEQSAQGCWDSDADVHTKYHAVMCACQALTSHRFRAYGPGIVSAVPLLEQWYSMDLAPPQDDTRSIKFDEILTRSRKAMTVMERTKKKTLESTAAKLAEADADASASRALKQPAKSAAPDPAAAPSGSLGSVGVKRKLPHAAQTQGIKKKKSRGSSKTHATSSATATTHQASASAAKPAQQASDDKQPVPSVATQNPSPPTALVGTPRLDSIADISSTFFACAKMPHENPSQWWTSVKSHAKPAVERLRSLWDSAKNWEILYQNMIFPIVEKLKKLGEGTMLEDLLESCEDELEGWTQLEATEPRQAEKRIIDNIEELAIAMGPPVDLDKFKVVIPKLASTPPTAEILTKKRKIIKGALNIHKNRQMPQEQATEIKAAFKRLQKTWGSWLEKRRKI